MGPVRADFDLTADLAALVEGKHADNRYQMRLSAYVLWEREFPRTASQKLKRDPLARELRPLGRALALREL